MKYIIVDICGTLYSSNTTFDFIKWKFKDNRWFKCYYTIYHFFLWKAINRFFCKYLEIDITRKIAVSFLSGYSMAQIMEDAKNFYDEYLEKKQNKEVLNAVKSYLCRSDMKVILASATLEPIASIVAKKLSVTDYFSTRLVYDSNMCTGKYEDDLLGNKLNKLIQYAPFYQVITDDISDYELIKNSESAIIITYPKSREKWQTLMKERNFKEIVMCNNISF